MKIRGVTARKGDFPVYINKMQQERVGKTEQIRQMIEGLQEDLGYVKELS
jgi:hypothetical protein